MSGGDKAGAGAKQGRVGVFGGTFDPVHIGHLIAAEAAREALGLQRVVFVPARVPPHKRDESMSSAQHRAAMLEMAIAGNPAFGLSRVDLDRPGPHYTVDMLRLLAQDLGPACTLYFVMGSDSLMDLPTWRDPGQIVQLATPVVVDRPGYVPDMAALDTRVPGLADAVQQVHMPLIGIAASDIERRIGEGRTIRYQVPREVEQYIFAHGLYGAGRRPPVGAARHVPPFGA